MKKANKKVPRFPDFFSLSKCKYTKDLKEPQFLLKFTKNTKTESFLTFAQHNTQHNLLNYVDPTTFNIMTLSVTAFSIMTLSIMGLFATLRIIDTLHKWQWVSCLIFCYAECRYVECHYAERRGAIMTLGITALSIKIVELRWVPFCCLSWCWVEWHPL